MTSLSARDTYLTDLCNHNTPVDVIPMEYRDDQEIVCEHVKRDLSGRVIKYASRRLKNDFDFGIKILPWNQQAVLKMDKRLLTNRDFVLNVVSLKGEMLHCFKQFSDDYDIALAASFSSPYGIKHVSNRLRKDEPFVRKVLNYQVVAFPFIDRKFFKDKQFVLDYITLNTHCMNKLSPEFLKDKDVVLAIMRGYRSCSPYLIGNALKRDPDVFFTALSYYMAEYHYSGEAYSPWNVFDWKVILNSHDYILHAIRLAPGCYDKLDSPWSEDQSIKYEAVYRGLSVETRFPSSDKGVYFVDHNRDFISEERWPIIKQALLYGLEQMLQPSAIQQVLANGLNRDDTLMFNANYVISQMIKMDVDSDDMKDIQFEF